MTVQEFLRGIPFNDVVEALRNSRLYEGNRLCVSVYKEAFDILCIIGRGTRFAIYWYKMVCKQ